MIVQNKFKSRIYLIYMLVLLLGSAHLGNAQTFEEARNYAFNGEREKARDICRQILSKGFNSDVALLMGRTYAWDGKYDSARVVLEDVMARKPENMEVYDALSDIEFWSDNGVKAIGYCDAALKMEPSSNTFTLKKAKILYSEERYEEAVSVLENYLQNNPGDPEFLIKLKEYRLDLLKNSIKVMYTYDFFEKDFNRDPWHLTAFSYGRKTKLGTAIVRVNYAWRFGLNGAQYEVDAYPKLGENSYGYLNYGFADNSLFPKNRFGIEWYHNFPHAFEGSLGMRYLDFGSTGVDIYTATFGKYVGNYWLSLRSFVTPDPEGTSVSGFILGRHYFSDSENYIGMRAGYGISPDDRRNLIDSEKNLSLKTWSLKAEYNHLFHHVWIFNAALMWSNEELVPGSFSGYYTFDCGISRLF